jgi:sensor histidine kinase YesM
MRSAATTTDAVAAAHRALLHRVGRGLRFMLLLCTAIALFLALLDGHIGAKFIYSFAIGLSCWALTDGMRLGIAWGMDLWRARRGLPPSQRPGFDIGWRGMAPLLLLAIGFGPVIGLTIGDLLTGSHSPRFWDLSSRGTQVTLAVTLLATLVAMVVVSALERAAALRTRAEAAQREAAETQLQLLQSQLEPHMLFNTLANLRVLIGLDPPRAQAMLDRLIAFLRATLSASRVAAHPLADEFARVDDYLALMAIRMGSRLQVQFELPPALAAVPVPPLLLQPLVENSIKHGLEPQVEGGRIVVSAAREGASLVLRVRDTGVGLGAAPVDGTRFGLVQVRERLHTLHGGAASLRLESAADAEGGVLATITLPLPP